jgi:molybdopterin-synthase adenylyltransferase
MVNNKRKGKTKISYRRTPMLNERERQRYDRQIILKDFAEEGQEKLKNSRILLAGAGGLGSVVAFYLAASGIGHLRIADQDRVDLSNLNRQILHWETDLDRPKVESALDKLSKLNQEIIIEPRQVEINEETLPDLMEGCDLVVDGLDNFPTRYLINQQVINRKVPFIYGGILGMMGMVTFIQPGQTPCLKCLFPQAPPPQKFPVLGTTPGLIGMIEANEAIKYLVGFGKLLTGRLLVYNGLDMHFSEIQIERNKEWTICG